MKVSIQESTIQGKGVFAGQDAPGGAVVGDGTLDQTTSVMRYLNHQPQWKANVGLTVDPDDGQKLFITRRVVATGEELTLDYGELLGYGTVDVWYLTEFVRFSLAQHGVMENFEKWLAQVEASSI